MKRVLKPERPVLAGSAAKNEQQASRNEQDREPRGNGGPCPSEMGLGDQEDADEKRNRPSGLSELNLPRANRRLTVVRPTRRGSRLARHEGRCTTVTRQNIGRRLMRTFVNVT